MLSNRCWGQRELILLLSNAWQTVPAGGAGGLSLEVDSLDSSNHNFRSTGHAKGKPGKDIVGSYTMSAGGVFVPKVSTMLPWIQLHVE